MTNHRAAPNQETTEESLERLRRAADAAEIGTFFCPLPIGMLYWNARCKIHFWLDPRTPDEEVDIDTFYRIIHPDDREKTRAAVELSVSSDTPYDVEYRTVSPHGEVRWLRAKGGASFDRNGRAVSLDGITIDISEQKRLEAERDELARSERTQRLAAQAANDAKEVFIAAVSHELRAPLTAILAWVGLLDQASDDADFVKNGISVIRRNVMAQTRLVEDLMDINRMNKGKFTVNRVPITVTECLNAALQDIRPIAEDRGIFVADLVVEPVEVVGDGPRLQQVFGNLLSNALKHTPRGGRILPSVVVDGNIVRISIADTGAGIPAARLEQIFQPFVQLENPLNGEDSGLGLGLAIARNIAALHGGDITVQSNGPGEGSIFTVVLPIAGPWPASLVEKHELSEGHTLKGMAALLVEDDADTLEALSMILRFAGVMVISASSAHEARELMKLARPDVIVSDLSMPGESGGDFLRSLRQAGDGTPAIALSGHVAKDDERKAREAGFDDYLSKPVDPETLLQAVARITCPS